MSSSSTLITFMILSFLFVNIDANHQLCSDKFTKLMEKRNITACKRLRTLGAEFAWNYQNSTNSSTALEILFGANLTTNEGWIAWGVNPGERAEMVGTKAIIGIKNPDFATTSLPLRVNTYHVTKETKSGCTLVSSKDIGLNVSHMEFRDEGLSFYTIYARLILPSDQYNITRLNHVWQIGDHVSNESPLRHPTNLHNVDSTETIDLTSSHGRSTGQFRSFLRTVHGVLSIIGWGTLLPLGVIFPRYFRVFPFQKKIWYILHISCQSAGFLIGTAAFVIGLVLGHSSRYYIFHTHRDFGILIFTFSTIQMLAFRLKPKKTDDYRKYWNMYHHFLGYGLLAIIFINIFKGIHILKGGHKWMWSYIGILICLGAIAFALEIWTWIKFVKDKWEKNHLNVNKKANLQQNKEKSENEDKFTAK